MPASDTCTEADVLRYHIAYLAAASSTTSRTLAYVLMSRSSSSRSGISSGSGPPGNSVRSSCSHPISHATPTYPDAGTSALNLSAPQPPGAAPSGYINPRLLLNNANVADGRYGIDPALFEQDLDRTADELGKLAKEVIAHGAGLGGEASAHLAPSETPAKPKKRRRKTHEGELGGEAAVNGDGAGTSLQAEASGQKGTRDVQAKTHKKDKKDKKDKKVGTTKRDILHEASSALPDHFHPTAQQPAISVEAIPSPAARHPLHSSTAPAPAPAPAPAALGMLRPKALHKSKPKSALPAHLASPADGPLTPTRPLLLPGLEADELSTPMQPMLYGRAGPQRVTTGGIVPGSGSQAGRKVNSGLGWVVNTPGPAATTF